MPAAQPHHSDGQVSEQERFAAVAAALRHRSAPAPLADPPAPSASDVAPPRSPAPPAARHEPTIATGRAPRFPGALSSRRQIGAVALAVVLLAVIALAGVRLATGPPAWRTDGALVVDASTGQRFVVAGQVLHAAPTLTAALLAGAKGPAREVAHPQVADAELGPALDVARDLPEEPPVLPDPPTGLTACTGGRAGADVEVYASAPALDGAGGVTGALVRAGDAAPVLLAGGRAHPITEEAITALGYQDAAVAAVPEAWLALTPPGPALDVLAPAVDPARGLAGIGSLGEVVADEDGRRYLVTGAGLAPAAGASAAALAPRPVRTVSAAVIAATAVAPPFGEDVTPATPPSLPKTQVTLCTRSLDAALSMTTTLPEQDNDAAQGRAVSGGAISRWHAAPGAGSLLAPLDLDEAPRPPGGSTGIVLVADGLAHPVATDGVLGALGYARDQTVLVPPPWLDLVAPATALALSTP